jgi:hypothetical protein
MFATNGPVEPKEPCVKRVRILWSSLAIALIVLALSACSAAATPGATSSTGMSAGGIAVQLPGMNIERAVAPAAPLTAQAQLAITAGAEAAATAKRNAVDVAPKTVYAGCGY